MLCDIAIVIEDLATDGYSNIEVSFCKAPIWPENMGCFLRFCNFNAFQEIADTASHLVHGWHPLGFLAQRLVFD